MTFEEFSKKASEKIDKGFIAASLTDEYILDYWPMKHSLLEGKENKILEIRIFNPEMEWKLFRTDVFKEFLFRKIDADSDCEKNKEDYFDQEQYLDIDTVRSKATFAKDGTVFATGGGEYYLPMDRMQDVKVKIRYYLSKSPQGHARIKDWRLVELTEGGKKNG